MTSREIIIANIEHLGAPRCGFTFNNGRLNDFEHIGGIYSDGYTQKRWEEGAFEYYDDEWGNIWRRIKGGSVKGEVHKAIIEDWDDLNSFAGPIYDVQACAKRVRRQCAEHSEKFRVAAIGGWIFDNARYLRKLENYLLDMAMYPEELKRIHSIVVHVYEKKIHAAGQGGVDAIMIGEDMGTQTGLLFSPEMWREFFKEEYSRLFGIAHEYGMKVLMHSCGKNDEILPDLLEAGVDCFQFDQPAVYDMAWLAGLLSEHKAALWAPVDIQKILPTGDRGIIEAGAEEMCSIFEGFLICKNYPDLTGIGVDAEWDGWAYEAMLRHFGLS